MKKQKEAVVIDTKTEVTDHANLEELIKKNIAWSEAIYKQNEKMLRHMKWMSVMGFIRVLVFLIPVILGIIYLPPILSSVWEQYQSLIGFSNASTFDADSVRSLLEQFSQ